MKYRLWLAALLSSLMLLSACNNDSTSSEVDTSAIAEETSAIEKTLSDYQNRVLAQKDGLANALINNTLHAYFGDSSPEPDFGSVYASYELDSIYPCYDWVNDMFNTIVILRNAKGDKAVVEMETSEDFKSVLKVSYANIVAPVLGEAEEPNGVNNPVQQPYTPDYSFHTVEAGGVPDEGTESEAEDSATGAESGASETKSDTSDSDSNSETSPEGTVETADANAENSDVSIETGESTASTSENPSETSDTASEPVNPETGTAEIGGGAE